MSTEMMIRRRAGMGALGVWEVDPNGDLFWRDDITGVVGPTPPLGTAPPLRRTSESSGFEVQLPSLIAGGLQTIRDIFAPTGTSQAAYGSQYRSQTSQPLSNEQLAALLRQQQQIGSTGSVGAQLEQFVTKNWILILVIGGILFFPGFSKRK